MNRHTRELLYDIIRGRTVDTLDDLAHNDIYINSSDDDRTTALHYASTYKTNSIIIKIIENFNVNVNVQDKIGKTPLHYATFYNNPLCTKTLLSHKDIKVNIQNKNGRTALHYAVDHNDCESLKL